MKTLNTIVTFFLFLFFLIGIGALTLLDLNSTQFLAVLFLESIVTLALYILYKLEEEKFRTELKKDEKWGIE